MQYLSPGLDAPPPTRTAVIVPVPAVDSLVEEHRRHLDVAASWGVPAHVSVLYPFVEPAQVDDDLVATLAAVLGPVSAFDCRFTRTRWFGKDVLWLDPEPAQPFRDLTAAVWETFPHHPPYGGAHDDVVPHLTIGERRQDSLSAVQAAEQAVQSGLPLSTHIEGVLLIAGTQARNSWRVLHEFRLRAAASEAG
jgi:2'-5' RNA ligase